jgi:anti-sigma factor RsiW
MRMAMIRPPSPESSTSSAGACTDWEPVLHAFFDGELNADDSLACQPHLGRRRNERSEIDEAETQAFRQGVGVRLTPCENRIG